MEKKSFLHKLFGTTPGEGMQPKEALSYSVAGLGQNLICGLVSSFVTYYFINGLLMEAATVGLIMLGVRVFDACNDPIMGSIVDRTKSKKGKCRPYLLWSPVPIAIFTVLLFIPLEATSKFAVAVMIVIYTLWSVVYTIIDVPYWGLASSMTSDTNQRGVMLTVARLFCTIGSGVVSVLIPNISNFWLKNAGAIDSDGAIILGRESIAAEALRNNYWWLALVIVLVAIPTFFLGYKNSNERFHDESAIRPLSENLKLIGKNKPLLIIIISGVLGSAKMMYMYSGLFFAQYNLAAMNLDVLGMKGASLFTLITMAVIPGGLAASLLVPWCTKKFGKKNTYIYSHLFGAAVGFVMFFAGWKTNVGLVINLIGLVLLGIPQGFSNIITYAMIGDSVDYLEWKHGMRAEGICFAMQTFINKIGMAVGAAFTCFGLAWAGIKASDGNTQTLTGNPDGLEKLFLFSVLLPAISMLLTAIPFFFYTFNEKEQAQAVAEVRERKGVNAYGEKIA